MATRIGDVYFQIMGDDSHLNRTLNQSKGRVNSWARDIGTGILQGIGQAIFNTLGRSIGAAIGQITQSVEAASNLTESMSRVNALFGESANEISEWAKTTSSALGLSERAALDAVGALGNLFLQLGSGRGDALNLSRDLVVLAADLASFHNAAGGTEEVLLAMQSAFRGEFDALQRFIPTINAASVEQLALAQTGKAATKELTLLEKAVAAQTVIMEGAGVAAGDFARTIGNVANQQRIATARFEEFRSLVGQAIAPIYGIFLRTFNQITVNMRPWAENIIANFLIGLANGIRAITPLISQIASIFRYWLAPGSPPRILPDLVKWGAQAMQEYLKGWSQADFGALADLGNALEPILRSFVASGRMGETDLVGRIFGTQNAIARAIDEFREMGAVSTSTIERIRRSAGPAGDAIADLAQEYFGLRQATEEVARAQDELTAVTQKYEGVLRPLSDELDALRDQQQKLRDTQRLEELYQTLGDASQTAADRELARLEIQEIELQARMQSLEDERDTAVDAAKAKVDATTKEQTAAQSRFSKQKAILDQQVNTNRLLGEEADLRDRLAREAIARQEEAMRVLEAAQKDAARASEEQKRKAEELYQATLQYNLAVADTEGKLALMRLELKRTEVGSVEYFNVLTQIAGLEQQLAREREKDKGAGAGIGGGASQLEAAVGGINSAIQSASDEVVKAWDAMVASLSDPIAMTPGMLEIGQTLRDLTDTLKEISPAFTAFVDFLRSVFGIAEKNTEQFTVKTKEELEKAAKEFPKLNLAAEQATIQTKRATDQNLTDIADWVRLITLAFQGDIEPLWMHLSDHMTRQTEEGMSKVTERTRFELENQKQLHRLGLAIIQRDWSTFWMVLGQNLISNTLEMGRLIGVFMENLADNVFGEGRLDSWRAGGKALITNFWDGLKQKWKELSEWWTRTLQAFTDTLPFSEPKDTSSPLYGLSKAGESIVEQIQAGMQRAQFKIAPVLAGAVQSAASSVTNNNYYFDQTIGGSATPGEVRQAARAGVMETWRARGGS